MVCVMWCYLAYSVLFTHYLVLLNTFSLKILVNIIVYNIRILRNTY